MLTGFHIKIAVFSTYVEVILYDEGIGAVICGILHVCGGDPYRPCSDHTSVLVFSTYVEVIPLRLCFIHVKCSILHVCGGDPLMISVLLR